MKSHCNFVTNEVTKGGVFKSFVVRPNAIAPTIKKEFKISLREAEFVDSSLEAALEISKLQAQIAELKRDAVVQTKFMIQNENDLLSKIENYKSKWDKAVNDLDELKSINAAVRTIGFTDVLDEELDNPEMYVATHRQSWDSWSLDTVIKNINLTQLVLKDFMLRAERKRGKIEISTRSLELRREADAKSKIVRTTENAVVKDSSEAKEKRLPSWKEFDKVVLGVIKTGISKENALKSLGLMGMIAPEGWSFPVKAGEANGKGK